MGAGLRRRCSISLRMGGSPSVALGAYLAANPDEILLIRADAALEGAALAALLPRLAALGLTRVRLATEGG